MDDQPVYQLFVGSYPPDEETCGIYALAVDKDSGSCTIVQGNAETANPSYLLYAEGRLYAANEQPDSAQISSFFVDNDGSIRLVDTLFSEGAGTCQIAFSPDKTLLYGADYDSGSIAECRVHSDGSLEPGVDPVIHSGQGTDPDRQEAPHVHMVGFAPDSPALIAVDLGIDALSAYAVGEDGLSSHEPEDILFVPAGEGPRMVAHHPTLPYTVLITELANHLIVYRRKSGELSSWEPLATYTLVSEGYEGEALSAHVLFSPDGRHLYASVRGPNCVVVFAVDETGALERKGEFSSGGSWPRHMALSSDATLLAVANERSDELVIFGLDKQSGLATDEVARCPIPSPTCAVWAD